MKQFNVIIITLILSSLNIFANEEIERDPTGWEQYMLEVINAARLDPSTEATKYAIALNEGIAESKHITTGPKQPLAWNGTLAEASYRHNNWLIATDQFSHSESKDLSDQFGITYNGGHVGSRITELGFSSRDHTENLVTSGLNPAWNKKSIMNLHSLLFVDPSFDGRGHRRALMSAHYSEIGINIQLPKNYRSMDRLLMGQSYAYANDNYGYGDDIGKAYITGVIYNDLDKNNFYTPGESVTNIKVYAVHTDGTVYQGSVYTSGGYKILTDKTGSYQVSIKKGGFKPITQTVVMTTSNIYPDSSYSELVNKKLDFISPEFVAIQPPVITLQPKKVYNSDTHTLQLQANGIGYDVKYQWYKAGNTTTIVGTASTLNIGIVNNTTAGVYYCVLKTETGTVNSVNVTVNPPPAVTYYSDNPTVYLHNNTTLSVEINDPSVTYAWSKVGDNKILSTSDKLVLNSISPLDIGSYQCVIDNGDGVTIQLFEIILNSINIKIQRAWNLVYIPRQINGSFSQKFGDASLWMFLTSDVTKKMYEQVDKQVDSSNAYWVYWDRPAETLTFGGAPIVNTHKLVSGWNLTGVVETKSYDSSLIDIQLKSVWAWDAESQTYVMIDNVNGKIKLEAGIGYWMFKGDSENE